MNEQPPKPTHLISLYGLRWYWADKKSSREHCGPVCAARHGRNNMLKKKVNFNEEEAA